MIAWVIETLVATSLLMLLVLVLRAPVRRSFGPGVAYCLWLLPVLRMMLPPLPGEWQFPSLVAPLTETAAHAPAVAGGLLNPEGMPPALVEANIGTFDLAPLSAARAAELAVVPPTIVSEGPSIALLVIALWVAGMLVFLAYHLVAHSRFCHRLVSRGRIARTVADGRVRVIESDAAQGPLAFGIWRKYVAFPRDFEERYDPQERDLALAHELGHHIRGDLVANWIALVMLAIHWFNPIAWRAFRAFRADQEMACDALVLAGRAKSLRHAYGRAIVKSAHGGAVSAACHLHTINEVKGRLKMLTNTRTSSRRRTAAGLVGMSALTLAALGLTASGTHAAESLKSKVEDRIGVDLSELELASPFAAHFAAFAGTPAAQAGPTAVPLPPSSVAPPAAAAPAAPPAPPAALAPPEAPEPPEPPMVWESSDGKKRVVRVISRTDMSKLSEEERAKLEAKLANPHVRTHVFVRDGKEMKFEMGDLPVITSMRCEKDGKGGDKPVVHESKDGKHKVTIICTDRIERLAEFQAKRAEFDAKRVEFDAKRMALIHKSAGISHAMAGLQMARRSIEAQSSLSADQRAKALAGIDEAIAELEKSKHQD